MDTEIEESITRSVLGKSKLTGEEIRAMMEMFKYYDIDSDGHLTQSEASKLFQELGFVMAGDGWTEKRIPMESFLLKCGLEKKLLNDATDKLESSCKHLFRMIDSPPTGFVNFKKFNEFLKEVDFTALDSSIERICELIAPLVVADEAEFTEDLLYVFIANHLEKEKDKEDAAERKRKKKELKEMGM